MARVDLKTLRDLNELRYRKHQEKLRAIQAQEAQLRAQFAEVEAHDVAAADQNRLIMGAIGADVLWKAWVGRSKRELNMKLARVLSSKAQHLADAKREYSRVLVSQDLYKTARRDAVRRDTKKRLDETIAQAAAGQLSAPPAGSAASRPASPGPKSDS